MILLDLSVPHSLGWILVEVEWGVLKICLPGLASNHDPPDLSLPSILEIA
jgi:hypothetical protein